VAFSVNKVILLGNVGRDPEIRATQSGKQVGDFSIATSERRGADGTEKTEWHKIVVWDKLADICQRYLKKGAKVYVEGRLQTREYTDRDGNKKYATEIIAQELVLLSGSGEGGGRSGGGGGYGRDDRGESPRGGAGGGARPANSPPRDESYPEQVPYQDDDDIPF
jgi:single-strand DNA-binding protein